MPSDLREASLRAAFETWRKNLIGKPDLTVDDEGYYEDWDTQVAWSGWIACAEYFDEQMKEARRKIDAAIAATKGENDAE
ncbi:hypothetical protein [Ralstonia mannitolilytica]|uniref:Uncharacterized protein n=1 Tax=Ralstonia mannitolilytica TaxID=105219 RepID=A0AAD2B1V6_9RALS|nr:hypothetical protein [Ralstonia mannitolilytica]MBY4721010.1 hypothetical protein [Ralstonia mannitolilytica]CAJ0693045.1 hypothetical protein R77591_04021 [Ralstonia mannitolilytica]